MGRMKLPRFTLRTLFITITLLSFPIGWVTYQLNWKRQRRNFVLEHQCEGIGSSAPWPQNLLGEKGAVYLENVPYELVEEARRLFPEAVHINASNSDYRKVNSTKSPTRTGTSATGKNSP
jgi:hypothetical protein